MSKKMMLLLALVVVVVSGAAATALAASPSDPAKGTLGKGELGKNKDFAGLVDIGGGRKMYMECRGKGSPTVVFVSGAGDRTETWSTTLDSSGRPVFPSRRAVLPAIAETNRVCAYDRPGTILATGEGEDDFERSRSDPVPQPTTLGDHAADLHALLSASGEGKRPYVVVGHSMGGAISKLYASRYPREVSGLVLIDYTPYAARTALTDRQWALWKDPLLGPPPEEALDLYPALEYFDNQRNFRQDSVAAPLKPMPFIALRSDKPFDLTPYVEDGSLPMTAEEAERFLRVLSRAWGDAVADVVGGVPGAKLITNTNSGHYIHQERPRLVTDSVREVVEAARKNSCALGSIDGTGGDDELVGTPQDDIICGRSGKDTISGLAGDDVLLGNKGQDTMRGGGGGDTLLGGNGRDRLIGGGGADELRGQYNNDALNARDGVGGNDEARGGPQTDACEADAGDEVVGCEH